MKLMILLLIFLLSTSHIYARNPLPVCEILESKSGLSLIKGEEIIGIGYSVSGVLEELENLLNREECETSFNRFCFYTDLTGRGRSIGIITNKETITLLGVNYGSISYAMRDLNRAKALGLCNEIISFY